MDQDLWLKAEHFHGPLLLQTILGEVPDSRNKTEREKLNMCRFIKNKLNMLFKPCEYSSDDLPDHSIPIVPVELFQDSSAMDRRDLFFKSLDRGNILILRVINDTLPDNYKLVVLCKEENCMKLDDLSIIMYLPKLPAEIELAGGKLESNDVIRAAVCSCSIDERKLYVTLDSNLLEDETENVKLGKITKADIPFYIDDVCVGSSYVEYLRNNPAFNNPTWSEELYSFLDIKKNYLYSFFEDVDGVEYPPEQCGRHLKKKQMLIQSNAQHTKAVACYENGNFSEAFMHLNNALKICPENVEALITRGTLYANTNNLTQAFYDVEEAMRIDPEHEAARKQLSVLLVAVARMHLENNEIDKAQEATEGALDLDSSNQDALVAIEEIRKKAETMGPMDKPSKSDKKSRIGSNSSERSESSGSKKGDMDKQKKFLKESTRKFLSSMKKKHHKKDYAHHHPKPNARSPKKRVNTSNLIQLTYN